MKKWFTTKTVGFGAFFFLIGTLIMRYWIVASIMNEEIMKSLRLEPGTQLWNVWTDIPIPIYTRFHFFNVTNPNQVVNGDKPVLKEVGPYVYQEKRMKIILKHSEDEVSYRPRTTWFFRPDLSYGTESDMVTLPNIAFVGVAKMAWDMSKQPFVLTTLDDMLTEKGERVFQTNTVRDLLFDGVSIASYMELLSLPATGVFGDDIKISERLLDGDYGFFDDRNGTADEVWVVKTGKSNLAEFGQIKTYNGRPNMDVWKGETCNAIKGTDGSIFPPYTNKNQVLTIFHPDLCRSLELPFFKPSNYNRVQTLRFTLAPSTFGSLKDYPENICYCNGTIEHCNKGGLMPIGPCQQGAPLFVSRPHFVGAHSDYQNGVIGLNPDESDYESYIELDKNTGQVVRADFRLQMNLELQSYDAMPTFANVPNVMFPLIWLQQTAELTNDLLKPVIILEYLLKIMGVMTGLTIFTCIMVMLGAMFWEMKKGNKGKMDVSRICC